MCEAEVNKISIIIGSILPVDSATADTGVIVLYDLANLIANKRLL